MKSTFFRFVILVSSVYFAKSDFTITRDIDGSQYSTEDIDSEWQHIRKLHSNDASIPTELLKKVNMLKERKDVRTNEVFLSVLNILNDASFPDVTNECKKAGENWLAPIRKAVGTKAKIAALMWSPIGKMIDAWGKPPSRMLMGNKAWYGAYDECTSLKNTHYCISKALVMNMTQMSVTYGSCFPKECIADDVGKIFSMLNENTLGMITFSPGVLCEEPKKYEKGAIITMVIMAVILALCILGTLIEIFHPYVPTVNKPCNPQEEGSITINSSEESGFGWRRVILCFSLIKNTKLILSTRSKDGAIKSINGIRVLSLTWVILGHLYYLTVSSQPDNVVEVGTQITTWFTYEAILNATVSVDSFFLISGLLVGYLTLKRIDKRRMGIKDVLIFYLHRYIRLTPSMALVILFYTNVFTLFLPGPLGALPNVQHAIQQPCYDNWWSNFLYINNFYPENFGTQCYGLVWYLANDMQFYVVAPGILLLMVWIEKKWKRGKLYNFIFILVLCLLSVMITGVIVGYYDLPYIGAQGDMLKRALLQNRVYGKPYCRITPYLVGLLIGYAFTRKITIKENHGKLIAVVGWVTAAVTALAIIYGPWKNFKDKKGIFTFTENLMYAMFSRFAWGCSVGWVIYACHNKLGGFVNTFLSWDFWVPLSKLSYGAYLLHLMVIIVLVYSRIEGGLHYQQTTTIFDFISISAITFGCSYILTVCVDYPVQNLERMIFKQ